MFYKSTFVLFCRKDSPPHIANVCSELTFQLDVVQQGMQDSGLVCQPSHVHRNDKRGKANPPLLQRRAAGVGGDGWGMGGGG